jgi:hypothetical protein
MEPGTLIAAVKLAMEAKKALDQAALKRQVVQIQISVDAIGQHLAADVMARMRAGFDHLETAVTINSASLRAAEFGLARGVFAELAARRGGDGLLRQHENISWQHVSAMGYLGNYFYFLLQEQPEVALVNAYRSVEQYPAMAVTVLPRTLFSPAALAAVPATFRTPDQIRAAFHQAQTVHRAGQREYRLDLAWRVPAAAAVAILGLAGGVVNPSLPVQGARGAMGLLATSRRGLLPESGPNEALFRLREAEAEAALRPLAIEAGQRRAQLERQLHA